ncbi:MAG TPA: hypothetical protein VNT42_04980 [Sphingomonas sp.]|nr:hypothetical protein [Sphingomonas sp.]
MALKARARGWLDAASQSAFDQLCGEVARLAGAVDALGARAAEAETEHRREMNAAAETVAREAMERQQEVYAAAQATVQYQREVEALRSDLQMLGERCDAHAARASESADALAALERRIQDDAGRAEDLRLKLVALGEQLRWESEDMRKALAAIIERVEHQRKTGAGIAQPPKSDLQDSD